MVKGNKNFEDELFFTRPNNQSLSMMRLALETSLIVKICHFSALSCSVLSLVMTTVVTVL